MPEKTTKNSSFEDIFLAIVSIFCFYGFILGVLYLFNFDIIFNSFEILNQIVLLLVVICCVLYFEIIKNHKTFLGFIGFRKEDIKTYIVATLAGFVLVVLAVGFLDYLSSLFSSSETNPYEGADKKLFDSVFVLSLLISPFSEEFFFRGFLQDILVEKLGAVWGIVITVLSFLFYIRVIGILGCISWHNHNSNSAFAAKIQNKLFDTEHCGSFVETIFGIDFYLTNLR
jgi:membrane protease YdiL (CAAX protease family)